LCQSTGVFAPIEACVQALYECTQDNTYIQSGSGCTRSELCGSSCGPCVPFCEAPILSGAYGTPVVPAVACTYLSSVPLYADGSQLTIPCKAGYITQTSGLSSQIVSCTNGVFGPIEPCVQVLNECTQDDQYIQNGGVCTKSELCGGNCKTCLPFCERVTLSDAYGTIVWPATADCTYLGAIPLYAGSTTITVPCKAGYLTQTSQKSSQTISCTNGVFGPIEPCVQTLNECAQDNYYLESAGVCTKSELCGGNCGTCRPFCEKPILSSVYGTPTLPATVGCIYLTTIPLYPDTTQITIPCASGYVTQTTQLPTQSVTCTNGVFGPIDACVPISGPTTGECSNENGYLISGAVCTKLCTGTSCSSCPTYCELPDIPNTGYVKPLSPTPGAKCTYKSTLSLYEEGTTLALTCAPGYTASVNPQILKCTGGSFGTYEPCVPISGPTTNECSNENGYIQSGTVCTKLCTGTSCATCPNFCELPSLPGNAYQPITTTSPADCVYLSSLQLFKTGRTIQISCAPGYTTASKVDPQVLTCSGGSFSPYDPCVPVASCPAGICVPGETCKGYFETKNQVTVVGSGSLTECAKSTRQCTTDGIWPPSLIDKTNPPICQFLCTDPLNLPNPTVAKITVPTPLCATSAGNRLYAQGSSYVIYCPSSDTVQTMECKEYPAGSGSFQFIDSNNSPFPLTCSASPGTTTECGTNQYTKLASGQCYGVSTCTTPGCTPGPCTYLCLTPTTSQAFHLSLTSPTEYCKNVRNQNLMSVNSVITATCDSGYLANGQSFYSLTCQSNGNWDKPLVPCTSTSTTPEIRDCSSGQYVDSGSTCVTSRLCDSNGCTPAGTCEYFCELPSIPTDGRFQPSTPTKPFSCTYRGTRLYPDGTQVTLVCGSGYALPDGSTQQTLTCTGGYFPDPVICDKISTGPGCKSCGSVPCGQEIASAPYWCSSGRYYLTKFGTCAQQSVCDDGSQSPTSQPVCFKPCPAPSISHAVFTYSPCSNNQCGSGFKPNVMITVTCEPGYKLSGSKNTGSCDGSSGKFDVNVDCVLDNQQDESCPLCEDSTCGVKACHHSYQYYRTKIGGKCASYVNCTSSGYKPKLADNDCDTYCPPVDAAQLGIGAVVTYPGTPTTCKMGDLSFYHEKAVAEISCLGGEEPTGGSRKLVCNHHGEWNIGSAAHCAASCSDWSDWSPCLCASGENSGQRFRSRIGSLCSSHFEVDSCSCVNCLPGTQCSMTASELAKKFCTGRSGFFPVGCTNMYFACAGSHSMALTCDDSTYTMDPSKNRCRPRSHVKDCRHH
jgi:hypothetical protein